MAINKLHKSKHPALIVHRNTAAAQCAVYILVADKAVPYGKSGSRIVYIGRTDRGMTRVHESAAEKSTQLFKTATNPGGIHGVTQLSAYAVSFSVPQVWSAPWTPSVLLERAFLIAFKSHFGKPPIANDQRNAMVASVEYSYFNRAAIDKQVQRFP